MKLRFTIKNSFSALNNASGPTLDLSEIERVDASSLQLLLATKNQTEQAPTKLGEQVQSTPSAKPSIKAKELSDQSEESKDAEAETVTLYGLFK